MASERSFDLEAVQTAIRDAGIDGWLLYDFLCKSALGDRPTLMMGVLFVIIVVMSWGLNQVFTGRAALLHLGAIKHTHLHLLVVLPTDCCELIEVLLLRQ